MQYFKLDQGLIILNLIGNNKKHFKQTLDKLTYKLNIMINILKLPGLIIVLILHVSCSSSQQPENKVTPNEPIINNRNFLYGIGEPLYLRVSEKDIDVDKAVETMHLLGVKCLRLWMLMPVILQTPSTPIAQTVEIYKTIIDKCTKRGIVVIGMSHSWTYDKTWLGLPNRSTNLNSDYMKWMINYFEKSWNTMAVTFPEINYWEIANETDGDTFLHKLGYDLDKTKVFSFQEKADITTDLMYYSSRGIHEAKQNAKVIMPAPSPVSNTNYYGFEKGVIEDFIGKIYANIKSGGWPSKNPRDYFQIANWHPYYLKTGWVFSSVDDEWLAINNRIYNVFKINGDSGIPVFLTEFGYSDRGIAANDTIQSEWLTKALKYVKEDMPYVSTFNVFRLFDSPRDASWGGVDQVYFGLFHINGDVANGFTIQPKGKGNAYANFIGAGRNIYELSK